MFVCQNLLKHTVLYCAIYRCIVILRRQYIDTCKSCIVPSLLCSYLHGCHGLFNSYHFSIDARKIGQSSVSVPPQLQGEQVWMQMSAALQYISNTKIPYAVTYTLRSSSKYHIIQLATCNFEDIKFCDFRRQLNSILGDMKAMYLQLFNRFLWQQPYAS